MPAREPSRPSPLHRAMALVGHNVDRQLPGRFKGRLGARLGYVRRQFLVPQLRDGDDLIGALGQTGLDFAVVDHDWLGERLGLPRRTILLGDDAVGKARAFLSHWPVGMPVDAFSPSGLPGFAFGDLPLLPPRLAHAVLKDADTATRKAAPGHALLLALFRLAYLRPWHTNPTEPLDWALAQSIAAEAARAGMEWDQPATLSAIDRFLAAQGWRPPLDMLERLGCWNPWIADMLKAEGEWAGAEPAGLTVFYIRQRTIDLGHADSVIETLSAQGFDILPTPDLHPTALGEIAAEVRGGNWGRGPFPVSGGEPGLIVLGYDPRPIRPDANMLKQFPLLDNQRIQIAKQAVRNAVHAGRPRQEHFNAMHSTDNSVQAWRAVRAHFDGIEPAVREAIGRQPVSAVEPAS